MSSTGGGIDTLALHLRGGRGRASGGLLVLHGASPAEILWLQAWALRNVKSLELTAVDGGYDACVAAGVAVDRFVGDGDSVSRPPRDVECHDYPADKNFSDLVGALRAVRRCGTEALFVAGVLGGRLDHEWANVRELTQAARHHRAVLWCGARGTVILTRHGARLQTEAGVAFSLFAASSRARVSLRGARWTLRAERLARASHGLSNRTTGVLDLTVHEGVVQLVFPESG